MAEGGRREVSVFWSQDNSDEDQRVAYVPGLCTEGNLRSAPKFKGVKSEERKARAAAPIPETTMDPILDWTQHTVMQGARTDAGSRSASLKDLCPEDKRRIANLIKELARVSEEKEVTEERLKSEHESFEKKIRHLEQQNELIATEREALQQQYRECQEMLSLYQKYLSEQQDKLSRSLSDLGAGSVQTHQVPKTSRQPKAHELNGSYIAPCNKQSSECESLCSVAALPCCRTESGCGLQCHPDRYTLDSCIRRKCCGSDTAEVRYQDATCGHHCSSALDQPLPRCCLHRPALGAQRRAQPELSLARHPEDCSFSSISATSGLSNGVPTRAKGSAMSEQRKHELLLQKMELEVEKERLQQLLEQHEAKLLEKQQELLQTKIESERHPLVIQTREVAVTTTPSLGAVPKSNGSLCSPVRPSSVGLPTPPSSKNGKVRSADGTRSGKKVAEPNDSKSLIPPQSSVCKGSRRDATTSPSVPSLRKVMDNGKMSPEQRDLCRYETSLIDMLDAISPISSQKECRRYKDPYDLCILSPPNHGYSKPSRKPVQPARREAPSMDLEESRMLEEIFFIC